MSFSLFFSWTRNAPKWGIYVSTVDFLVPLAWVGLFHSAYAVVALADSIFWVYDVAVFPNNKDSKTIDFLDLKIKIKCQVNINRYLFLIFVSLESAAFCGSNEGYFDISIWYLKNIEIIDHRYESMHSNCAFISDKIKSDILYFCAYFRSSQACCSWRKF